ncbi:FadR/GntR family transcriptional regulator [Palleronia sp. LCG004]|uniref:FadR/GntR family transcriptional regulator n=1 Tax=Palleronia sp. LCG004 TaxID=3079304 RepID=UPI0029438E15|nr:FCD domain-containing protein [Palleronia sp. LCG004]WOI55906.1 FCD domain-containing protein [Palleronia sp. LCG004]
MSDEPDLATARIRGGDGNSTEVRGRILQLMETDALGRDGRLPTERDLAEICGTTRRIVRRALAALESEGLVWRRQGKGTFAGQAADPTGILAAEIARGTTPLEVMEARLCVEPELAALAARRASPDDVERMHHIVAQAFEAADPDACELWDGALHRLIARSAENRPLQTTFAMLDAIRGNATWRELRAQSRSTRSVEETLRQHRIIVAAIAAEDSEAARGAMRTHLKSRMGALATTTGTAP